MPKVVDHDAKRKEIALNATKIFLEHGYKNIGMRQLCERLGMSKSAVYHYYKSKEELFRAATVAMVNSDAIVLESRPSVTEASLEQKIENFLLIFRQIAPRFFQEMKLVTDYIEVIGLEHVADDSCMRITNQKYLTMLADYVSTSHSDELFTLMLGLLNHQFMVGNALEEEYMVTQVKRFLK